MIFSAQSSFVILSITFHTFPKEPLPMTSTNLNLEMESKSMAVSTLSLLVVSVLLRNAVSHLRNLKNNNNYEKSV